MSVNDRLDLTSASRSAHLLKQSSSDAFPEGWGFIATSECTLARTSCKDWLSEQRRVSSCSDVLLEPSNDRSCGYGIACGSGTPQRPGTRQFEVEIELSGIPRSRFPKAFA